MSDLITIKKGRAKNFFSIGNEFYEFDYSSHLSTLILGKNGSGKSSCGPDLITYALYGKPYRDIKLGQLINSINNKNMLVELEFSVLGNDYLVRRGQKPNIFEIYKDGTLLNQEAATKDYQKILETQILRMPLKAFKQWVVIGSSTYKPFMQLSAGERRQIIEDVLDISIFTKMGEFSRQHERELKSEVSQLKSEISIRQDNVKTLIANLSNLEDTKKHAESTRDQQIEKLGSEISELKNELNSSIEKIEQFKPNVEELNRLNEAVSKIDRVIDRCSINIQTQEKSISNIQNDIVCETCKQEIPEQSRKEAISSIEEKLTDAKSKLDEAKTIKKSIEDKISPISEYSGLLNDELTRSKILSTKITELTKQLKSIPELEHLNTSINNMQSSIQETQLLVSTLNSKYTEFLEEMQYYSVVSAMLKDTGIKSTIVENYLPVINQLINGYLEEFGLFVGFELSSTFDETIRSRDRDIFSYNSFSEGEKAMIDLAILFTWRQIATSKNSMSCNLLFLDEVGGASLDVDAHTVLINTISKIAKNVFLITHRETDEEIFDRVWEFSKPKNYSIFSERI